MNGMFTVNDNVAYGSSCYSAKDVRLQLRRQPVRNVDSDDTHV